MKPALYTFKNGALITVEKNAVSGMCTVLLRNPAGEVHDKVRVDDRREYFRYLEAFKGIARNL